MICSDFLQFVQVLPKQGALIALDYGAKKIGVAASDASRMIATPVVTIYRKRFDVDLQALNTIIEDRRACALIIGLPFNMDGSMGARVQSTKAFARNLSKTIDLPICFWDERLSTQEAQEMIAEYKINRKKRPIEDDEIAAAIILQEVLEKLSR
jgi:putative holliday junction resolvase